MKIIECKLWDKGEYHYPMAFDFIPQIKGYLHDDHVSGEQRRPCMIIVPGGAYVGVSPSEGEIVALDFYRRGYNVFVCVYTTNPVLNSPLKLQPMKDLSRAVRHIRCHAGEYQIDPSQITVCGFSAGAHLCGSLCVHHQDIVDENAMYQSVSNNPNYAILAYPVVTSGKYAHKGSFFALLGEDASSAELEYMSLEKQITDQMVPCFIWQTLTDETVPVENSLLLAKACGKHHVPFAYHVFSQGIHGLSLASTQWEKNEFGGELYTLEQSRTVLMQTKIGNLELTQEQLGILEIAANMGLDDKEGLANPEVAVWTDLAEQWLKQQII